MEFTEFGTTGIEYVFGRRNNFNHDYGNASRINAMIQYRFWLFTEIDRQEESQKVWVYKVHKISIPPA